MENVCLIRRESPRIGALKLYVMLCTIFGKDQMPGRDTFLGMLRKRHLMLPILKGRSTTNSNHRFHKYKNLIKEINLSGPNQLWVSDITYISLKEGVCYLHLVTDAFSHKILGWCVSSGLQSSYTLQALEMAMKNASLKDFSGLIHHSDRGIQYCCKEYVQVLCENGIRISMTEDYKPTENAIAERVNGIIKSECLYRRPKPDTLEQARNEIEDFIQFYNLKRPHMSIGYETPQEVYCNPDKWLVKKKWKNNFEHKIHFTHF